MRAEVYDYIVIGSGSSGGVVAARLSEDGRFRVLCLEAGTKGANYIWSRSPIGGAFMIENPEVNWCDYSEPNESSGGRPVYVPHGKMLGGSSSINGTICNRGQAADYDSWAQLGCTGWSFQDVLPFFKKLERSDVGTGDLRGRSGPVRVTETAKVTPFYDLFIRSAEAVGIPSNPDYCGASQRGVAMAQQAALRGVRNSTATQYLRPARRRRNLTVRTGAEAAALILEGERCTGVRYRQGGRMREARATREVVVSCGAINTPKLLELSGIGNPEILGERGIAVAHALPGVGENLRDHYGPTLRWTLKRPGLSLARQGRGWRLAREVLRYALLGKGFVAQGIGTMRVFTRSHEGIEDADIQMIANPFVVEMRNGKREMSPVEAFFISTQVQRPESVGSVHVRSADPSVPPAIRYSFLATENDRRVAVAAVRQAREIVAAPPLADAVGEEVQPGPAVQSDAEIVDFIRNTGATTYHAAGTCKMGRDPTAVVDERLRVHGLRGLRVADASIMPTLVSGNTGIPCIMIGEKCAAMMIEDADAGTDG